MELFHFDIEVAGEYPDYNTFLLEDERGAKLFESKFKKMGWESKYENVETAYLESAGIISTYGKICCISFGYVDDSGSKQIKSFYGEDERDIVNKFNELLKKIETKAFNLSGFRVNYFDIPYILHKLHKYGIKPANIIYLYDKKPWDARIVDIADDWKQKFAWAFSFDEVCYELGISSPKENMNGSEVHKYYWEGKLEDIKNYCESDVSSSIDVGNILYN
jgi:predicted PolB exonuclease-like 3'-5' exonuclease